MITLGQIAQLEIELRLEQLTARRAELEAEPNPEMKMRLREMWATEDAASDIARAIRQSGRRGLFF